MRVKNEENSKSKRSREQSKIDLPTGSLLRGQKLILIAPWRPTWRPDCLNMPPNCGFWPPTWAPLGGQKIDFSASCWLLGPSWGQDGPRTPPRWPKSRFLLIYVDFHYFFVDFFMDFRSIFDQFLMIFD